jgi:integrase
VFDPRGLQAPRVVETLTFRQFAERYKEKHVLANGPSLAETVDYRLKPLLDYFGDRPLAEIRTADVQDFIADLKKRRARPVGGEERPLAAASINRSLQLLRHMLNWAVGREYIDRTPFKRGTDRLIRPELEDNKRQRRVSEEEESKLLEAAPPMLRSMIIAALDTGMRRGEMLALQFGDIDWQRQLTRLRGATTKSGRSRVVPIGTGRLLAVLKWLRLDADGKEKPNAALVFSNEAGEPIGSFRRAWVRTVLKAHGTTTAWSKRVKPVGKKKGGWKELTPECASAFKQINLHWHDLRHEYASRLVERGVPLAQVRDLLGHASITTTERYDNQTLEALQAAAARLETGKQFDAAATPDAGPKLQDSFKIDPEEPSHGEAETEDEAGASACGSEDLEDWLGGRDSNPDNVVQRDKK